MFYRGGKSFQALRQDRWLYLRFIFQRAAQTCKSSVLVRFHPCFICDIFLIYNYEYLLDFGFKDASICKMMSS